VGSGFTLNGLGSVTSVVGAGNNAPVTLSHSTATAGAFSSTVSIANTSLAVAGSGLSDLPLAGQSINVLGNVYAAAVASVSPTTVNFGVVRQGAASPTGNVGVTNTASGALTDSLVTSTSGMPVGVSATSPAALAAGQSGNVSFALNTATAGVVSGSGLLNFKSTNGEMADLTLASQSVAFSGTVTELASGTIFKNAGLGVLAGGGNAFTLDLGSLAANSGAFTTDLGVTNLVVPSAFAELLGGSFTQGAGTGFSFAGNSFSGLVGGTSNLGNLLSFDTTGLANGTYTKQVTFNGFSAFTGLNNFNLTPINVNITAQVTGNVGGAVPEPATWMMMLFGFGLIGGSVRRNRLAVARQLV
jgi:PEP-CTERM motif